MDTPPDTQQIVFTNKANCRDCYRCLRVCPVKAIRMAGGQAYVDAQRCISCGTCIRECPQNAKSFRRDVERAAELVKAPGRVAASVAPSFVALLSQWQRKRLPSVLRKLGFDYVGETAIGAYHVAQQITRIATNQPDRPHICTACPAAVNYIEKYRPDLLEYLTPVVSPMIAHARHIKQRMGNETKVVFIGPCVAKKAEAEKEDLVNLVDCAITFDEMLEWLNREGIDFKGCEESAFDEQPMGDARLFPLEGGALRTGGLATDVLAENVITVTGIEQLQDAFDSVADENMVAIVEPMFCRDGCINGPAIHSEKNLFARRKDVLDYAKDMQECTCTSEQEMPALNADYTSVSVHSDHDIMEENIRQVLAKTGKRDVKDELNCGACGYLTCRDKAIAVLQGMAELEMCIPYMRRLAEQRTDRIIETSPNGIIILDERLNIIHMNPAFRKYFMCSEAVCGKPIAYLMDPHYFEQLASGETELVERTQKHEKYNLVCHEILYALRAEKQYVGIFVNITRSQRDKEMLLEIRNQTMLKARELLDHQVEMAQKLAQFLGESTARGEDLLENLMLMVTQEEDKTTQGKDKGIKSVLWDIYTSK